MAAAAVLLSAAGCGGDEKKSQPADPFTAVEQRAKSAEEVARGRAAPRWEEVRTLDGMGAAERRIRIDDGAVQWRVRWRCEGSRFAVGAGDEPLGSGSCPGRKQADGRGSGAIVLRVAAEGRWQMIVEQQVTTPLIEPPLPALGRKSTRVVRRGRFRPIERRGAGKAVVHRLASGRLVLRLDGFSTAANTDLAVWLSTVRAPRTTTAVLAGRHRKVADLKATLGDQNYMLPRDVTLAGTRSIVIWCEPVRIAYTAATLRR
jgi:hypothetical protein